MLAMEEYDKNNKLDSEDGDHRRSMRTSTIQYRLSDINSTKVNFGKGGKSGKK